MGQKGQNSPGETVTTPAIAGESADVRPVWVEAYRSWGTDSNFAGECRPSFDEGAEGRHNRANRVPLGVGAVLSVAESFICCSEGNILNKYTLRGSNVASWRSIAPTFRLLNHELTWESASLAPTAIPCM